MFLCKKIRKSYDSCSFIHIFVSINHATPLMQRRQTATGGAQDMPCGFAADAV